MRVSVVRIYLFAFSELSSMSCCVCIAFRSDAFAQLHALSTRKENKIRVILVQGFIQKT